MLHLIGFLEYADRGGHLRPASTEIYQHQPRVIWKLHRALYGLRKSPKCGRNIYMLHFEDYNYNS